MAAGTDDTLPVITCVRFEWCDHMLWMAATDRYRLVTASIKPLSASSEAGESFNLQGRDVKELLRMLPKVTNLNAATEMTVTLEGEKATFTWDNGSAFFTIFDGDFPKWRGIVDCGDPVATEWLGVNPALLASLTKIHVERNTPWKLTFHGSNKPLVATHPASSDTDPQYTFLLMPVRLTA
jgi:DNA polymerase-3 subunit beta